MSAQLFRRQVPRVGVGRQLRAHRRGLLAQTLLGQPLLLLDGGHARHRPGSTGQHGHHHGRGGGPSTDGRSEGQGPDHGGGWVPIDGRPPGRRIGGVGEDAQHPGPPARVRPSPAGDQVRQVPAEQHGQDQDRAAGAEDRCDGPGLPRLGGGDFAAVPGGCGRPGPGAGEQVADHPPAPVMLCSSNASHSSSVMSSTPAMAFIRESVSTMGFSTDDSRCLTTVVCELPIFHNPTPTLR